MNPRRVGALDERVLVIKLGALGDMILAFPAFERIRAAHRRATITLLTTQPFADLARAGPWFDRVEADGRPARLGEWLALARRLRRARYERVYDLQTNDRTNLIFQALRPDPPMWSGTAFGCALPHRNPGRMRMHALERQAEQLRDAGIWPSAPTTPGAAPPPDVVWMVDRAGPAEGPAKEQDRDPNRLIAAVDEASRLAAREAPFALLVPGASPKRPAKRWPVERFGEIARRLGDAGWRVAVIGGADEEPLADAIRRAAPEAIDLTGATDLFQLAALGRSAGLVLANDTGPAHLLAAAGAPSLVLFSADSDPALCAPRGRVSVLAAQSLDDLGVEAVWSAVSARLDCGERADHIAGRPFTTA